MRWRRLFSSRTRSPTRRLTSRLSSTMSELPESSRTVIRYQEPCTCFFSISLPAADGRCRVSAAAADLVADDPARDTAENRADVDRLVIGRAVDLDRHDRAAIDPERGFGDSRDVRKCQYQRQADPHAQRSQESLPCDRSHQTDLNHVMGAAAADVVNPATGFPEPSKRARRFVPAAGRARWGANRIAASR